MDRKQPRAYSSWEHLLPPLLWLQLEIAHIQDGNLRQTSQLAAECQAFGHRGPWREGPWRLVRVCVEACFVVEVVALPHPERAGA